MTESVFTGEAAEPGQTVRTWSEIGENYLGVRNRLPYILIRGAHDGPRGVILATIHGDELNGIQIIHKLAELLDPQQLKGQLVLVPIANVHGFVNQSRYLADRRDLNRLFPGRDDGSEGARLAAFIWQAFIEGADFGIDLHSASYNRWNYPHIRGNMRSERVRMLAHSFGAPISMHSQGVLGSLRREATRRGIPFILFEAGQTNRFEFEILKTGLSGVWSVLKRLEMVDYFAEEVVPAEPCETYYRRSAWVRADNGGLFLPLFRPGENVEKGDVLGHITSSLGEELAEVTSEITGRILGLNLHPQVVPGRALYHIADKPEQM